MNSWIVVTTCRREPSYLEATLAALEAGGAGHARRRIILADGELPSAEQCPGWEIASVVPGRATPTGTSVRALFRAFALAEGAGVERLVMCEDDIVVCRNAILRALTLEIPDDLAFVDFCDLKELSPDAPAGIHVAPTLGGDGRGYHGAQLMSFPERTIRYLAPGPRWSSDRVTAWAWRRQVTPRSGDMILGATLAESPWPHYGIHVPCLAEHVGEVSGFGDRPLRAGRIATCFPGVHYDALIAADGSP